MFDEDVYKSFTAIVAKAKKACKTPESKQFVADWEGRLEEAGQLAGENELADQKASKAKKRVARRKQKATARKKAPSVAGPKRSTRSSRRNVDTENQENVAIQ